MQQSIIKTLAYFDLFSHPLTKEEIYHWLFGDNLELQISYADFLDSLEKVKQAGVIEVKNGFYFLPGRAEVCAKRQKRIKWTEDQMRIAVRGVKKISWLPFIRAVFVCNTVGLNVSKETSDIDVFIVVQSGRLWFSRLIVTAILSLFGLRRNKTKIQNKICLSFYVTDDNLNLDKIAIKDPDIYLIYWLDHLIPLYNPKNLHSLIIDSNSWARKYLPNGFCRCQPLERWRVGNNILGIWLQKISERLLNGALGNWLELWTKKLQQKKMARNYKSVQNESDTKVVINDRMLKFHENDRRQEYRERWLEAVDLYLQNDKNLI